MQQIKKNETTAGLRTVPLEIFGLDGLTPDATKDGDQPQISYNGGAFINTDNTLDHITGESYSLELSQIEIDVADLTDIKVRFTDVDIVPAFAWAQIIEATNKEVLDAVEATAPLQHFAGATSAVIQGTTVSGSYLNTFLDDGVSWVIQPGAGGMEVILEFNIGLNRIPPLIRLNGKFDKGTPASPVRWTDTEVYNYVTAVWDQISDVDTRMNDSSVHADYEWFPTAQHVDPTTGAVRVKLISASTNTNDRLEIDRIVVLSVSESSGLTPDTIAEAVWDHKVTGHEDHATAAFHLRSATEALGEVIAVTDTISFQVSGLESAEGILVGHAIDVHDEDADVYYKGIIKTQDAAGNIVLYEALDALPIVGAGVIVRNRNFDHEHDQVDVGSIDGSPVSGDVISGVFQRKVTIRDGRDAIVYTGDYPTLQLTAPEGWDFSSKRVFFKTAPTPGGALKIDGRSRPDRGRTRYRGHIRSGMDPDGR